MKYDVIVCGGGIAGVSAALAAARNGAKVLIVEREFSLGGLATLGLICIYLPLCDGAGYKMSSGIAEELLKLSIKYGPGNIPQAWIDNNGSLDEKINSRYKVKYNPASFIIAIEELLLKNNVKILYGTHISGVRIKDNVISAISIETKMGKQEIEGKTFIDTTGDADICYFAGEKTVSDNNNRKTGWYFSYDNKDIKLNTLSDPLYSSIPKGSRLYSGIDIEDISQSCIDGRRMIIDDINNKKIENKDIYPLIIPSFHGLRMTRRYEGNYKFSEADEGIFFNDAIGTIGSWKKPKERYTLSLKIIEATKNKNLYVAGRCVSADNSGQDLTRVIPSCSVTGEAAGTIAAYQAINGEKPSIKKLQEILINNGVIIDKSLFRKIM